MQLEGEDFFE